MDTLGLPIECQSKQTNCHDPWQDVDLSHVVGAKSYFVLGGTKCDVRTTWLAWKRGLMPPRRKPQYIPSTALSPLRQAIVNALMAMEGCEASLEDTETMVREMTAPQAKLWFKGARSDPAIPVAMR